MSKPQGIPKPPLGNPSFPRYYHHGTGLVEEITGNSLWHRNRAKGKLIRLVRQKGGDPSEIEYCAGMGPGLMEKFRGMSE